MSKSNAFETNFLNHIFKNLAIANIGDATGLPASATAGNLYISLHTADPGEAGDQSTSEAAFTSYARVAVTRGAGWNVAAGVASNVADVTFPQCTGGTSVCTHFGIGTAASGAGNLLFSGALTSSLSVSNNVTAVLAAAQLTVTED
jgi:hypothetical protein